MGICKTCGRRNICNLWVSLNDYCKLWEPRRNRSGYYSPDPDYKDDVSIYRGYHTYDSFGYKMDHIMEFNENGKVVRIFDEN